uniref:Dynamin stalk domain-containing protein n=1 Tax=Populus alba TaxID=43335 RepID=A0A4U5Q859_POPAL|nr:hypothetical protein D5086_0000127010 [Populus alba]
MVGIPVLAQKLVQIQATIIARCLPEIVRKINDKLNASISELNRMPKILSSVGEALTNFHGHCWIRQRVAKQDHCELRKCSENDLTGNFLMDEIQVLEEAKRDSIAKFPSPHHLPCYSAEKRLERYPTYQLPLLRKCGRTLKCGHICFDALLGKLPPASALHSTSRPQSHSKNERAF